MRNFSKLVGYMLFFIFILAMPVAMAIFGYELHLGKSWDHMSYVLLSGAAWCAFAGAIFGIILYLIDEA
jgi:hypothetical protein